jgi:hypothetical protein
MAALTIGLAMAASAQPSRTFVASTGLDSNAPGGCARTAPCRSFGVALGAVAAGGEVVALDSAGYGPMEINKSVTITSEGVHAAISATGPPAIMIQTVPGLTVTVRNLRLVGAGATTGIHVLVPTNLNLENVVASGFEYGAMILSSNVRIKDSVFRQNSAAGIHMTATGATIETTRIQSNGQGLIAVNGSQVTMRDSISASNLVDGVFALWAADDPTNVDLERCAVLDNGEVGVHAWGANARIRVSDSRITMNSIFGVLTHSSGRVESFGDNKLAGNNTNGTFDPPPLPQQ